MEPAWMNKERDMPYGVDVLVRTAKQNKCLIFCVSNRCFYTPQEMLDSWESIFPMRAEINVFERFKLKTPSQALDICSKWQHKVQEIMDSTISKIREIEDIK
ncbi:hypothetical protein [Sphingobacterium psychroaquaticum]|uniref:Uncharacterized protein n=1 Tax=Sphingobacterium psychroaquaticum TaxID=561061 RepID=A0A1X7JW91_9SPHI|nr:hypothetical protein [Sphingobacterium psychroaquaticum]SMG32528.1 hypothetical protein SAMN05660862_2264 [Sphingobacterium psychroaquaticum]